MMHIIELIILYIVFLIVFAIFGLIVLLFGNGKTFDEMQKRDENATQLREKIRREFDEWVKKVYNFIDNIINKIRRK